MLHTFQVVLLYGTRQCSLFLAKEGMEEFFHEVDDPREAANGHQRVVLLEFEQLFEHGPVGEVDEQWIVVDAVFPGEYCQLVKEFLRQILHGQFMGTENEQSSYRRAGGRADKGAVAGIGEEDVIAEGAFVGHNLLAMAVAGLSGSRLYPGSWSEWSADPARPVARSG